MLSLCSWLGLVSISGRASGALVNITVDDNDASIVYSPSDDWSYGPTCTTCTAKVDASKTHNGSWHDTLFSPQDASENFTQTIEFSFTGTAIYVFGILSNAMNDPSGNADYLISIDGALVDNFVHKTSGDGTFVYNSTLYANASLSHGSHTLKVQNGQPSDQSSFILFDYLMYSTDSANSTPSAVVSTPSSLPITASSTVWVTETSPSSTPSADSSQLTHDSAMRDKILTGVLVPVLVILIVLVTFLVLCCRRARARDDARSRLNRMSIASPFLSSKTEEESLAIPPNTKKGAATYPLIYGGNSSEVESSVDPTLSYPPGPRRPALVTTNGTVHDSTSFIDPSSFPRFATNPNMLSGEHSGQGPSVIPFPFGSFPDASSGHGPVTGMNATMPQVVFAPIQLSGATGYPLLAAWPQTASRDNDSAPPAYASEAGSP